MSLKSTLNQIIRERNGEVYTLKELEEYCHKYPAKLSQAERRLRRSESPEIKPVYNEKHTAIIGYKYAKDSQKENPIIETKEVTISSDSETGSGKMRPMWHDSGTISGPYISHRPIPAHGVDNH